MGKLITVIGPSGVGKTVLAKALAKAGDFALFESFLDEWLATLNPIHIMEVNVPENDPKYTRLVLFLMSAILDRFGKI